MSGPTILVADDHPMFREALKLAILRAAPDARILEAGQLGDAAEAARRAERLDLILLDLRMPGADGFSGVALMHAERPETPIIVVSSADRAEAAGRARAYGARGFISKTADLAAIQQTIARALAGDMDAIGGDAQDREVQAMATQIAALTPTELKVLLGVIAGRLNKQIAFELGISEATVKGHMTSIMRKLGVHNRTQVVIAARALDVEIAD
ncbi:response regulator transcription factor [Sphingomonas sp. LHG3406-1]|uniref:response regulator transcription factor n=1 Tax=Sphingomonas sp. LHG3406-1 TaxID=2804617 RepID=UPI002613B6D6|nr:response regulator transcription factor [Sphingomonas sp. LHG3406-1]